MGLPTIDLDALKKQKEENFQDRLRFVERYADWVRKNKDWSIQHKKLSQ